MDRHRCPSLALRNSWAAELDASPARPPPPRPEMRQRPPASPGFRMILLCCFYQVIDATHYAWWNEIPIWD